MRILTTVFFAASLGLGLAAMSASGPAAAQEVHSSGKECNNKFGASGKLQREEYIYFETDSAAIAPEYLDKIERVYERATGQHMQQICLFGKASKKGNAAYNSELARKRSEAVARAFQKLGWPASKIAIEPEGEAMGWIAESLTWDSKEDRRVRIRLSM